MTELPMPHPIHPIHQTLIRILNTLLLADVPHADYYLTLAILFLSILAVIQTWNVGIPGNAFGNVFGHIFGNLFGNVFGRVFRRPPSVPLKVLPRRPALQVLFKPDEDVAVSAVGGVSGVGGVGAASIVGESTVGNDRRYPNNYNPTHGHHDDNASMYSMPSHYDEEEEDEYDEDDVRSYRDGTHSVRSGKSGKSSQYYSAGFRSAFGSAFSAPRKQNHHGRNTQSHNKRSKPHSSHSSHKHHPHSAHSTHSPPPKPNPPHKPHKPRNQSNFPHPINTLHDVLPDSFAPLLSSSEMEILKNGISTDLLHALHVRGSVRLKEGRHSLPLNKEEGRPQFWFDSRSEDEVLEGVGDGGSVGVGVGDVGVTVGDVEGTAVGNGSTATATATSTSTPVSPTMPSTSSTTPTTPTTQTPSKQGCKLTATLQIGSETFTPHQDLDPTQPTSTRSHPLVKLAELHLDPPLRLGNVAPTLLHFPELFEDKGVVRLLQLKRIPVIGWMMEWMSGLWFLMEKCLWWLERRCEVHLGKVKAVPVYCGGVGRARGGRGAGDDYCSDHTYDDNLGEYRLSLSFTGHLLLFHFLPIPFFSYKLPTFIIPQPHALIQNLLTSQPLASAKLKRENIAEEKIVIAALNALESWSGSVRGVVTPPALEVDLTLPGGITVAVEMMHGRDGGRESIHGHGHGYGAGHGGGHSYSNSRRSMNHGRDGNGIPREISDETLSTWMTNNNHSHNHHPHYRQGGRMSPSPHPHPTRHPNPHTHNQIPSKLFDANSLIPWYFETSIDGSLSRDKIIVNVPLCMGRHVDEESAIPSRSMFSLNGSVVICRAQEAAMAGMTGKIGNAANGFNTNSNYPSHQRHPSLQSPKLSKPNVIHKRQTSNPHLAALTSKKTELVPVHALLLYPETYLSQHSHPNSHPHHPTITPYNHHNHLLEYDYAFDVSEETQLSAISLSYGASHPMLNGGTIISCVLQSIYAYGGIFAREGSMIDPSELMGGRLKKRNILKHLPGVDLMAGVMDMYLLNQRTGGGEGGGLGGGGVSYFDDGNTKSVPEMEGGRIMIRIVGGNGDDVGGSSGSAGVTNYSNGTMGVTTGSSQPPPPPPPPPSSSPSPRSIADPTIVNEGIKLIADFGVSSFSSDSESKIKEFPELEIFQGTKLLSFILGTFDGCVMAHLRPQSLEKMSSGTTPLSSLSSSSGPNMFNPLEAYEIDFSGTSIFLRLKEASFNLGHRRVIVPTETTFAVNVIKSIVNMSFEGTTQCEVAWDFQGSSPILQVTSPGKTPAQSSHEHRQQEPLLIKDLCQGRLNLDVSSVGGISFTQASTSREDKEGLYDWKFFNAIVSPDEDSPMRIRDVLYDKKTMFKLLAVSKLINSDLEKALRYFLTQVWRAKEIFDQEGISDPGNVIPGHKMARLVSLFLCGDISQVDEILPIIRRVVAGNGLDIVKVKELLRKHVDAYDEWAAEIDRAVKWAAVMLGPMTITQPFVESEVPPLSECIDSRRYGGIPTAKQLYEILQDKPQLPLDSSFSNLVSRVAPYMTFRQVSYVLHHRPSNHWQPFDLKRLRYVYSIKKKVQEISESYGGLSFLPQSFFVSIFLGEATRSSLRATFDSATVGDLELQNLEIDTSAKSRRTVLSSLRHRRFEESFRTFEDDNEGFVMSPAGRVASMSNLAHLGQAHATSTHNASPGVEDLLGDSLLGPQDVAVLLQAGLTSVMKGSTVVQLNQRMLLDLMAGQPKTFAIAVLAELGTPGGQGAPRALTSALMAFLEMDQSSFKPAHRLDMHNLLESWLPGLKIPRREDYLAGGRWARQSYYDAIYGVAVSILDLAEIYTGLKLRIQQVRHSSEKDPVPMPKETISFHSLSGPSDLINEFKDQPTSKLSSNIANAIAKIKSADDLGQKAFEELKRSGKSTKECSACAKAISAYKESFAACKQVLSIDKLAFQADWFKSFYRRNYDALMVKSIYDNVMNDDDRVRVWMEALRRGSKGIDLTGYDGSDSTHSASILENFDSAMTKVLSAPLPMPPMSPKQGAVSIISKPFFTCPEKQKEQDIIDAIIEAIFFDPAERDVIKNDPLVRLLISNEPGHYNFTIITAMGVITEGKKGLELQKAIERLEKERGVLTIRADTGTARSMDYNANRIEEAVEQAMKLKRPYGLVGYSQGCANEINFESMMLSGTPEQQKMITSPDSGLVCRQLLFSAANGSVHGPAGEAKVHQLITMCEDFFKYQQGYFSRAFISSTLEILNDLLDSSAFQKFLGGAQSFFPDALRAFWREAQHMPHIPTCVLRGVLESHTTPESLEMITNLLTKQSGSALHDSQVHVYDAVGHPVYVKNRNGRILKNTDMGGAIQRTHHWSPLSEEVEFVKTNRDVQQASFDCAKDRHIFPFCDINARFGIIRYKVPQEESHEK